MTHLEAHSLEAHSLMHLIGVGLGASWEWVQLPYKCHVFSVYEACFWNRWLHLLELHSCVFGQC
jgi:hypothetical protein